jgi:hypothetical protein
VSPLTDRFVALDVHDVRFPTSDDLDGSDAMNPNPDYSAAYAVLRTDAGDGLEGYALAFTTGPGNDLQIRAIEGLADWVVGRGVEKVLGDLGAFSKELIHEPHLRWLGPEKGVVHMAAGAVINAGWDLRAKRAGRPLWQHLAWLEPEELVSLVDFRYLTGHPPAGRQARDSGLPARRQGRIVRDGPARVDVRLRRRLRKLGRSRHRARRPSPRAFRHSRTPGAGPLPRSIDARRERADAGGLRG